MTTASGMILINTYEPTFPRYPTHPDILGEG
jgi:hypothetical protein